MEKRVYTKFDPSPYHTQPHARDENGAFGTDSKPAISVAVGRLTVQQYLTYTATSLLTVAAFHLPHIIGANSKTLLARLSLLVPAFTLLSHLHTTSPRLSRIFNASSLLAIYTLGHIVPLLATWLQDHSSATRDLSPNQIYTLHFTLAWYLLSETDYWRRRLVEKESEIMYPEYLYFYGISSQKWYKRLWPARKINDPKLPFWRCVYSHRSMYNFLVQAMWMPSLWAMHYVLRSCIDPSSKAAFPMSIGCDTIVWSYGVWKRGVQMILFRWVRLAHVGVLEGVVEWGVGCVERVRERRRWAEETRERESFAFYA